jgi:hypothetical protein
MTNVDRSAIVCEGEEPFEAPGMPGHRWPYGPASPAAGDLGIDLESGVDTGSETGVDIAARTMPRVMT